MAWRSGCYGFTMIFISFLRPGEATIMVILRYVLKKKKLRYVLKKKS